MINTFANALEIIPSMSFVLALEKHRIEIKVSVKNIIDCGGRCLESSMASTRLFDGQHRPSILCEIFMKRKLSGI